MGVSEGVMCVGDRLGVYVGVMVAVDFVAVASGVAVTVGLDGCGLQPGPRMSAMANRIIHF